MKIKFNHFDHSVLKTLSDQAKLGYFLVFMPHALHDGLRAMCEKYHIELRSGAENEIMKLIAERLKS